MMRILRIYLAGICLMATMQAPSPVLAKGKLRLISLAPSNTEIIYALKGQDQLVAVSDFCDNPPQAASLPKAGTFVSTNLERIASFKPDLILLVSGQEALAEKLKAKKFKVMIVDNNHLANIPRNFVELGRLTGHQQEGQAMARDFTTRLAKIRARSISQNVSKPTVFYCVWTQPLMTVGKNSFLDEAITTCGGINIAGEIDAPYPQYSVEKLISKDPQVLILPFEAQQSLLISRTPWKKLSAAQTKRVYYLPRAKDDNLSRPTMRLLDGLIWLSDAIHR
jgi:iron complex transport system substrate-binding protein